MIILPIHRNQLNDDTVYLEDLDTKVKWVLPFKRPSSSSLSIRSPALKHCGVFDKVLVDKYLKDTYKNLPKLPGYVA